ncbi:hypothetical protein SK355_05595 [Candidatus Fukatsuia symbiotica]|uniref:hypothetical protein n=1 Tax=Candidatus Fukatsuia TaxID=1927833 RepID=UPI0013C369EB|nr:hypothetical protein [Candidatus Fukatsuia symbiotica]MEA9444764.1 hypothetical protein [Candidatus Fukatsuia symbiotica]
MKKLFNLIDELRKRHSLRWIFQLLTKKMVEQAKFNLIESPFSLPVDINKPYLD